MKASIEDNHNVIIGRFEKDVYVDDIIDFSNAIFSRFDYLTAYKGLVIDFLDAEVHHKEKNLNILVKYLEGNLDRMKGMKVATVMDTPFVTIAMMLDRKIKQIQIRPFTTMKAAMHWITL